MSDLVLLVEPGSTGAEKALARVHDVLAGTSSVALIAKENQDAAIAAVGADLPSTPSIVLTTSGSSGLPRAVELPVIALRASAERATTRLGGPGVWFTALPVTGAGGLNTVVRSLLNDVHPVIWPGLAGAAHFDGEAVLPSLRETRARARAHGIRCYTSLVPTQVARLVAHARAGDIAAVDALGELAHFDAVLVGADALDDELRNSMRAYEINVITTYGATETCGGCVFDGTPLPDVQIDFMDNGRIVVSGPLVAARYRDGESESLRDQRWISNDLGRLHLGRLQLIGRIDDVIKVGGQSVALPLIAEQLRGLADLKDIAVLSRPDTEWGQVPVAYVVDCEQEDATLRRFAAAAVGRTSIPMDVVRLDALPLLPNGKVDRQHLLER